MTIRRQSGESVPVSLSFADKLAGLGFYLTILLSILAGAVWVSERLTRLETKVENIERRLP